MTTVSHFKSSAESDAFGRLRVGNPQTVFDSKQIFDNLPLFWDDQEVSGTGTDSTHSQPNARSRLSVDTNAGKRVRQTFQRFNYQPGKSMLVILTAVLGAGTSGLTQEVGYFDDNNGLFFRCDGGVLSVVVRSKATGFVVDTVVNQADWNIDKLNGAGHSGITLDLTKTQIFFLDFEWLGVGRVRFGFYLNGQPVYCHEVLNTNNLGVVYMSTPNLPVRYSIENDGTAAAANLDHLCSSVISEGGIRDNGVLQHQSTAGAVVSMAATVR